MPGVEMRAQSTPSINSGGIVNAASYAATLAPGSIGAAFGNFPVGAPVSAGSLILPTSLGGVSLEFGGGVLAPLLFASSGEVNFQMPWEQLAGDALASVVAASQNQTSAAQTVNLAPFAPGIFSMNGQGTGQGAIVDTSYRVVDSSNPASAGTSLVAIYATGLGAVTNQPATGSPSPSGPLAYTIASPTVTIGGAIAAGQFSGLAPELVGVYQINVLVPAASATGNAVPVTVSIGGIASNIVTMAVNAPLPSIGTLAPFAAAPGTGPLTLTIDGAGFLPTSTVTFNRGVRATSFVNTGQLTVMLTAADLAAAGSFAVAVINPSPGGASSNTVNFIVQAGFGIGLTRSVVWSGFAGEMQHSAISLSQSQSLNRIHWSTPVDFEPQFGQYGLDTHYGSPLVTAQNTAIVPVKTGVTGGFRVDARSAADGTVQWSFVTDYILPSQLYIGEFAPALTPASRLYIPGAGGTVYFRDAPDSAAGPMGQIAFYGLANYQANPQPYDTSIMISTPITSDSNGDIYFGFQVAGATPLQLQSGIARIGADGQGTWISAAAAAGDASITEVTENCAPALNEDKGLLYIAVSANEMYGYLLALDSTTLQPVAAVRLKDPLVGLDSLLADGGTASPTIGVDGDVYFGVIGSAQDYETDVGRGWLLHFDSLLSQSKTPGAFGWDDTASVLPAFMVPSYTGSSPYLLMTKYNDYYGIGGGTGLNKMAVLDPDATETDPVTGATVMKEVLTILGPTPDPRVRASRSGASTPGRWTRPRIRSW